jgi:WD40 repeat protein
MRQWTLSFLLAAIVCTPAWAEAPRVQQIDRRNSMFPELVLESGGQRATCDALAFTRDGKHLLAVGDDKVIRVWDYRDGQAHPDSMKTLRWGAWGPQREAIYALAVSPDAEGRRVAIGGLGLKTTEAAVIDRLSGKILKTITPPEHPAAPRKEGFQSVRAITFSPSGECIAFGTADGSVWLWRPECEGTDDLKWLGEHSRPASELNRVRLLHFLNEKVLLSVAQNGETFQWDLGADTREPVGRLKLLEDVGGGIHDVLLSPDGKWLAARAMSKPFIYVRSFDGKQRKDIELEKGAVASSLAFDARGQVVASIRSLQQNAGGFHIELDDQIRLYDLSKDKANTSKGPPHSGSVDILAFHPDGKHLAVAGGNNHQVTLWDLNRPQAVPTELCGIGNGIWNVSLSKEEDGRYLAFQTHRDPAATHPNRRGQGSWAVFDLRRLKLSTPERFAPSTKLEGNAGWRVKPMSVFVWHVENRDEGIERKLPWDQKTQEKPRCYAFLPHEEGQPARLAVGHYHGVSIFELTEKEARLVWQGMGHEGEVMSLAVSADGKWMVSASDDQTICAWSLSDWPCRSELGAEFIDDGKGQVVVKKVDLYSPAWEAGLVEKDTVVGFKIGREVKFFRPKGDSGKPVGRVDACLKALENPEPGKVLIFRIKRGREEWIDTHTSVWRRPMWRFFPTRDKQWVLWMGQHPYYETSNNGDKYIGWQMNNKDDPRKTPSFYRAEQFRELFYQPRVISKLLVEQDIGKALEKSEVSLEPPNFNKLFESVSVRIKPSVQEVTDAADMRVTLVIEPRIPNPDYMPVRAELWINDHRLEVWDKLDGKPLRKEYTIKGNKLRQGDNDLTLQCYNNVEGRGRGRLEASVSVHCDRKVLKRNLYGLVVGINDYSRSAPLRSGGQLYNLNTPFDDMEAIRKAWLSQQGGKIYSKVDIALLPDKKDGKLDHQTILTHFQDLAEKAGPDDQVFVFLAGHGMVLGPEDKGTFVFCCPDFDEGEPKTYISARKLYELLASIPCQKVVFLDVCHPGEVARQRPVRDLTPGGRGPIILAACDRGEFSHERPPIATGALALNREASKGKSGGDLKLPAAKGAKAEIHSYFVTALLEAFQEERADEDGNGLLDAREIFAYTSDRVPELINEDKQNVSQNPTSNLAGLGRNILLARGVPPGK